MDNAADFSVLVDCVPPAAASAPARVTWQIGILLQDLFPLPDASNVAEIFDLANRLHAPGSRPYAVNWLSARGGMVRSRSGMCTWTERADVRHAGCFDMLFVVGDAPRSADEALDWRRLLAHPNVRETAYREGLALVAMPAMQGVNEPQYADAAGHALSLVRRTSNAGLATRVAQQLTTARLAAPPNAWPDTLPARISEPIKAVAHRMREDCEQCLSIPDAAQMASMSERNFLRRFKLEMGVTPSEYLLRARLDLACALLADLDLPVDKIARRAGLGCGDRLAKLFRQRLAMSPTEYRVTARYRAAAGRAA
ncbi:helix-turn-helix domain-containing protein (plasmid) [Burkholderia sp. FERM BP-3421]|jgi:AraC family transcriptional regulator, glycine betaine-responsive activator|uniref:helix-turn-helix domain-containing protein n=1 Tax=Burkholderia sp. FERM BP-3421 TaxID=1494466 RepID=UPI002362DDD9|nr:helix-turn-helix domain-containing protein [Burkholderia sp. FERM BP-3421]WDD90453.1 helix-turn-helix domain-containing protein [Burkholderia sp. FERM BP-3421]